MGREVIRMKDLYYVKFWDHCKNHKKIVECELVGWIVSQDKKSITFAWWKTLFDDEKDNQEVIDNNMEIVSIVRKAIIKKKKILLN